MSVTHAPSDAEQLQQRNRELSILNAFATALNRSVDLEQTLETALSKAAEVFELHTGWVWLMEESGSGTYLAAAQNLPPGLLRQPELMQGSCYCLDTYRAGDLAGAANVNVITCSRLKKLVDGTDGLRYHASVPLYAHGRALGMLNVASADWRELTDGDLRLLYTLGDMLSLAIERARLFAHSAELGALEERNRLARELHDTLAQSLAGITLQLESAEAILEAGGSMERLSRAISQALEQARASLEEARRSVLDLRAAPLEGRSLSQALAALAASASVQHGLKVEYSFSGGELPLPARLEAGLYRIAQEAVANAAQHAQAKKARLELAITPARVRLAVADQGQGFDPAHIPPGRFGLLGINERARLLGGELHIKSTPGQGTRLEVDVPLAGKGSEPG